MNILTQIFERKRLEVEESRARVAQKEIEALADQAAPTRGFLSALRSAGPDVALIAEVKKASPSKGLIRQDFDPAEIARSYARAGAAALSVLTDEYYFQGRAGYLELARETSGLPCLRKDFIFDPYQVYEARAWGADAILLIVAGLSDEQISALGDLARQLGMDVLVEVHSEEETKRALSLGEPLIGVNNRDLGDFRTTLDTSDQLLPLISPHAFAVSESGLESRADLDRVQAAGAQAVLIGTTFCAAPDIEEKVREVLGGGEVAPARNGARG